MPIRVIEEEDPPPKGATKEVDPSEVCLDWVDSDVEDEPARPAARGNKTAVAATGSSLDVAGAAGAVGQPVRSGKTEENEAGSVCCALFTMAMSIPALVGAWCWPLLLAGAVSGLSSSVHFAGMKQISHTLTWGFNLAVLSNMAQFLFKKCSKHPIRRHRSHFLKYAPAYLCVLATVLVMVDLTRHVVNDAFGNVCMTSKTLKSNTNNISHELYEAFKAQDDFGSLCYSVPMFDMYNDDGSLSTWGWIGFICTWAGFICLVVSVFWGIDMHRKMAKTWKQVRGPQNAGASTGSASPVVGEATSVSSNAERNAPLLDSQP